MKKPLLFFMIFISLLQYACRREMNNQRQVLLLLNSASPEAKDARQYLIPYLDHFGIPFDTIDVARQHVHARLAQYNLIILGHRALHTNMPDMTEVRDEIWLAAAKGTGILSFDPIFSGNRSDGSPMVMVDTLVFAADSHFITAYHQGGSELRLFDSLLIPLHTGVEGDILISSGGAPFLWMDDPAHGRMVCWASGEWMKTRILGPMGGLDDCLWRSMVWAARKPFVMRGLPPIVTMRVDDVAGRGVLWGKSPLYWVKSCNSVGFKPWLGLFIYNLNPETISELRGYLTAGQATASPHAFGRPPRSGDTKPDLSGYTKDGADLYKGFYYYPDAIPLREMEYDEFIYFDHQHYRPWSDEEAKRGLEAVDEWYAGHQPLPMSDYFIAHWYEMGTNVMEHVSKKWGMEFIAQNKDIDMPWHDTVPWVKQGPFRLHESPGTSTNTPTRELRGNNPVYYADFTDINGCRFFNCFTEIRDDAGYEWAPDNDIKGTAGRGIRQLTRALNSMALAVLFTHETDYIYLIRPENWEQELQLIAEGIKSYDPVYMTSDEALKTVRATRTSQISGISYRENEEKMKISFTGSSDVQTSFWLFGDKNDQITRELVTIPSFKKDTVIQYKTTLYQQP